jgi:hypothetical protein
MGDHLTSDPTFTMVMGGCPLCAKKIQRDRQVETVWGNVGPLPSMVARGDHLEARQAVIGQ